MSESRCTTSEGNGPLTLLTNFTLCRKIRHQPQLRYILVAQIERVDVAIVSQRDIGDRCRYIKELRKGRIFAYQL